MTLLYVIEYRNTPFYTLCTLCTEHQIPPSHFSGSYIQYTLLQRFTHTTSAFFVNQRAHFFYTHHITKLKKIKSGWQLKL